MFVLRLFRMSLSMVSLILSAKFFGVSMERDLWVLVTTFIGTVGGAVWGPVNETFRAKFIFIKEREGDRVAASRTISLLGWTVLITLAISAVIFAFRTPIVACLSPNGSSAAALSLSATLLMVMLPTLLVNQLNSICISILNAYDIFYVPELVGVISSVLNIAILWFLAPCIGIYSLAVSQYSAVILLLAFVIFYLKRIDLFSLSDGLHLKFSDFKVFLLFALPFFFPYFVGQVNALAEKWLVGMLGQGYISSLDYARQFSTLLQAVLSSVLTTVMVPMLAKAFAQGDKMRFSDVFKENLTVGYAILALAIPLLLGAATPLCEFFFQRGQVSPASLQLIISLTRCYAVAFMGVLLYILVGYSLLASNNGRRYAFWGVLVQALVLVFNISFLHILGVYAFPLSLGLAHFMGALSMAKLLWVDSKERLFLLVGKYMLVVLGISIMLYMFNSYVSLESSFTMLALNVLLLLVLVGVVSPLLDLPLLFYLRRIKEKL